MEPEKKKKLKKDGILCGFVVHEFKENPPWVWRSPGVLGFEPQHLSKYIIVILIR
jgi:hypothetical protein